MRFVCRLIFCLSVLWAPLLRAQEPDSMAQLTLHWSGSSETADLYLYFGATLSREEMVGALEGRLGCEVDEGKTYEARSVAAVEARCSRFLKRKGLGLRGEIDLAPIEDALTARGVSMLMVTLVHDTLQFRRVEGAEPLALPSGWRGIGYLAYEFDLTAPRPLPITFSLGYDETTVRFGGAVLTALLFLPLLLTLGKRRNALRQKEPEENAAWFGFWRYLHWLSLGTFFFWSLGYVSFSAWGVIDFLMGGFPKWARHAVQLGSLLLPPFLVLAVCKILAADVLDHVRGQKGAGRRLMRAAILGNALIVLPLFFALVGALALFEAPRAGLLWLVAAFAARLLVARAIINDQDFTPHSVTVGELRDRVFELARQLGTRVQQLYVVPAREARMANAFAVRGGNVILTDFLLANLDKKELDGVIAHELAHLRNHHPLLLTLALVVPIGALVSVFSAASSFVSEFGGGVPPFGLVLFVASAVGLLFFFYMARHFELRADADAVLLTRDPEAMISALAKLTRLNLLPRHWGRWTGGLLTHPSLERRAEAIAGRGSLSADRLQRILHGPREAADPYHLPEQALSSGRVFSTAVKFKISMRNGLALIGMTALVPAVWLLAVKGIAEGATLWVALGAGFLVSPVLMALVGGRVSTWGYKQLSDRLRARLRGEGLDVGGGVFVSFVPDRNPRLYENFTGWDVGLLFFTPERLVYLGDQTRFELERDRIQEVRLRPGFPSWHRSLRLFMRWKEVAGDTGGEFCWTVAEAASIGQGTRLTIALKRRIDEWLSEKGAVPGEDRLPDRLPAPTVGEVTSESPRSAVRFDKVVNTLLFVSLAAILMSLGLGFGFSFSNAGGWYVLLVSLWSALAQLYPLLRYRDPAS